MLTYRVWHRNSRGVTRWLFQLQRLIRLSQKIQLQPRLLMADTRCVRPLEKPTLPTKRKYSFGSSREHRSPSRDHVSESCASSQYDVQARSATRVANGMSRAKKRQSLSRDGALANLQVGNERSIRQSAGPVAFETSNGYNIVLTLPNTNLHKTVAIEAGDGVHDLFPRVEEKMGPSSPPGNWQLELRFPHLPNKGKGGYLVDRRPRHLENLQ